MRAAEGRSGAGSLSGDIKIPSVVVQEILTICDRFDVRKLLQISIMLIQLFSDKIGCNRTLFLNNPRAKLGLFYVRYLDFVVFLIPTRPKLRKAIEVVNRVLD